MRFKIGDIARFDTGTHLYKVVGYSGEGYDFVWLHPDGREIPQLKGSDGEYMVWVDHQAPTNLNAYLELFV